MGIFFYTEDKPLVPWLILYNLCPIQLHQCLVAPFTSYDRNFSLNAQWTGRSMRTNFWGPNGLICSVVIKTQILRNKGSDRELGSSQCCGSIICRDPDPSIKQSSNKTFSSLKNDVNCTFKIPAKNFFCVLLYKGP
jgi:hypothetical protein